MNGKLVAGGLVLTAALAGAAVWWLQLHAFYDPVAFQPGEEIRLTPILGEVPEVIIADEVTGIDAASSPLRFRACFTTPLSQAMLTETYRVYPDPTPLNAPPWFDCFDARRIDQALRTGEAIAFLSERDIAPGVDRVVAVFSDGRAYAWHQLHPEDQ
ncbi:hypothetical protein SAMN05878503_10385 [Cereibacter ovatus]|uniref:Histidine kinase n=1 Tax=Cereibacter ovatus TaxID=439529 RepID=A0A285CNH6_9RHOB|nr:DUF6446 family protein [Cereibacter ovatus]SNX69099.1 hypothetical protein SAMN05878503_10385 [Cereibacter ovatus]